MVKHKIPKTFYVFFEPRDGKLTTIGIWSRKPSKADMLHFGGNCYKVQVVNEVPITTSF